MSSFPFCCVRRKGEEKGCFVTAFSRTVSTQDNIKKCGEGGGEKMEHLFARLYSSTRSIKKKLFPSSGQLREKRVLEFRAYIPQRFVKQSKSSRISNFEIHSQFFVFLSATKLFRRVFALHPKNHMKPFFLYLISSVALLSRAL